MVAGHPAHIAVLPHLIRVKERTDTGFVAAHSLAELYATLSRLPIIPRISPTLALQLIQSNVVALRQIISLSSNDYVTILDRLASQKIAGGVVYDALLLHAAWIANVDRVVTLNPHDLRRVYPPLANKIVSPLEPQASLTAKDFSQLTLSASWPPVAARPPHATYKNRPADHSAQDYGRHLAAVIRGGLERVNIMT